MYDPFVNYGLDSKSDYSELPGLLKCPEEDPNCSDLSSTYEYHLGALVTFYDRFTGDESWNLRAKLYCHIYAQSIALILGTAQMYGPAYPTLHRMNGYAVAVFNHIGLFFAGWMGSDSY